MSTLVRSDNTPFAIQAYRELVKYKKKSLLIQRIRAIAEQQGQFVRLFKRRAGEYEAVFSAEPGFLLGESVKQYFQQQKNLIFCEASPENSQLLLVVVKDGNVFTDTLVIAEQLKTELLPLTTARTKFQIVLSGEIKTQDGQILQQTDFFPPDLTISYERLDAPLLPRLPAVPAVRLLPLPLALKSEHLYSDSLLTNSILIIVFLIALMGLFAYLSHLHHQNEAAKPAVKETEPYANYVNALQSPAPKDILQASITTIEKLYQLPGWQPTSITQINGNFIIAIKPDGGSLTQLQHWTKQNDFVLQITSSGVNLVRHKKLAQRTPLRNIYPLQQLNINLIDTIEQLIVDSQIDLGQIIPHLDSKEMEVTLHLADVSPQQLFYLKEILNELPVVLNSIHFTIAADSLIGANIQLSIWGK